MKNQQTCQDELEVAILEFAFHPVVPAREHKPDTPKHGFCVDHHVRSEFATTFHQDTIQ